ncbi:uncharacterized protein LOC120357803 isoform X2 [Solenopsis invicta]|uniref:uncharacterized protein LOC120357803 isoform X2 n=1 Tax=Solenopsis invicta TaxID=13686 RepID=UPI00193D0A39|nr:uncharacterized protein LOC120357803 isoform X2 [Solenopsis invicta]
MRFQHTKRVSAVCLAENDIPQLCTRSRVPSLHEHATMSTTLTALHDEEVVRVSCHKSLEEVLKTVIISLSKTCYYIADLKPQVVCVLSMSRVYEQFNGT